MKKYMLSLVALVVAVAAMAFTHVAEPAAPKTETIYQFDGNSSQLRDLDHWKVVEEEIEGCDAGNLPCYVKTDMSISDWLNQRNDQQIANDADGKKF